MYCQGGDCTASLWGGISCNKGLGIYEIALQKTKQLTASDGHVLLLEYLEETPLLLSRPGQMNSPAKVSRLLGQKHFEP